MSTKSSPTSADAFEDDSQPPKTGFDLLVFRLESAVSVLLLGSLVVAGLASVLFRGNQHVNTSWVEPFTQHVVLWIALFGAAVASRDQKHITVDAIGQLLPPHRRRLLHVATDLLSACVCAFVAYLCCKFVGQFWASTTSIKFFGIPERILQLALPLGFVLITIRFLTSAWRNFAIFRDPESHQEPPKPQSPATAKNSAGAPATDVEAEG